YEDRTRITPIANLREGETVLIEGEIAHTAVSGRRKTQLICEIGDESGKMRIHFFHFYAQQLKKLQSAHKIRCYGEVRVDALGHKEMTHPDIQLLDQYHFPLSSHLTPVYPTTKGVQQWLLRKLIDQALKMLLKDYKEPQELLLAFPQWLNSPSLKETLEWI